MPKLIDLIDKVFGRLIAIKRVANSKQNQSMWLCKCNCKYKTERIVLGNDLRNGHTKSCGCLRKEIITEAMTKHGHNKRGKTTKIYYVWQGIIQRCCNSSHKSYKDYGGRGIKVCKRWLKFENFNEDMGKGWKPGLQIDRIKNSKGYCKANCHWVTSKTNNRNRRNNRLIEFNEKIQCIIKWSEETGINKNIILWRLNHGWSTEKALTTLVKNRNNYENN